MVSAPQRVGWSDQALKLLEERYLLPGEKTPEDMCSRVARVIAGAEEGEAVTRRWFQKFYDILISRDFLPNSPTLSNAGTDRCLSACFVLPVEDSLESIFKTLGDAAKVHQSGGGTGFSFGRLRPDGAPVRGGFTTSNGPINFMAIYNLATEKIKQGRHRRGANMGILPCLTGDTLIHTVGGLVPIEDLVGYQPYVYACDPETREIHVVQADQVIKSGYKQVLRVWFDNDEYIDCTPDHEFLLASGEYRKAWTLSIGDSLMAFEKRIVRHGTSTRYVRTIGCTGGRSEYEHRVVARDLLGEEVTPDWHVHHRDEDSLNNMPWNLKMVNRSDHATAHVQNLLEYQQRIGAGRKGKTLDEIYGPEKAALARQRMSDSAKARAIANHKVVRVELTHEWEWVYDILLPKYHNFVANGVFVHNCTHPDLLAFIDSKKDGVSLNNFNISVAMTDEFMECLESSPGIPWTPIDPHTGLQRDYLSVGEIWERLVQAAWETGDPGLFFVDRANQRLNPVPSIYTYEATNPCGEVPLFPYDVCNLGSINLGNFVIPGWNEFSSSSPDGVDWGRLKEVIHTAVRFLDNLIDVNTYPLPEIEGMAKSLRRIGLGVMGWADMLAKLGVPYASEEGVDLADRVMGFINAEGILASMDLAKERGPYPLWDRSTHPPILRRNCAVTCIAPTGTISIIAGASSGIEPYFALSYTHNNQLGRELTFFNPILGGVLGEMGGRAFKFGEASDLWSEVVATGTIPPDAPRDLRDRFQTAGEIDPTWHIRHQAAFQKHTENAVSKTINLPNSATVEDVDRAYRMAYREGCMGITVYRDGSKGAQVLNVGVKEKELEVGPYTMPVTTEEGVKFEVDIPAHTVINTPVVRNRPTVLPGYTFRISSPEGKGYLTINERDREPFEAFVTIGKGGSDLSAMAEAMGRLISLQLRTESTLSPKARLEEIRATLEGIGGSEVEGFGPNQTRSLPDAVAKGLGWYLSPMEEEDHPVREERVTVFRGNLCPECKNYSLIREEGCSKCHSCGYSKC